tara:strand:- start:183 stop:335 length:153 start_codon:yes stop_codon:yes gene_type:complete
MTVEQLKINEIDKNNNKEINFTFFIIPHKQRMTKKKKFQYENGFQLKEQT